MWPAHVRVALKKMYLQRLRRGINATASVQIIPSYNRRSMLIRLCACVSLMACIQGISPGIASAADFPGTFHVTGIPGVKRGQKIDITLATDKLVFEHNGVIHEVSYARIGRVLLLPAARNYEKTMPRGKIAVGGAVFLLKKNKVDTVVVDYENERGGRMGLVVQMESGKGAQIGEMLRNRAVMVDDLQSAGPKEKSSSPLSQPDGQP